MFVARVASNAIDALDRKKALTVAQCGAMWRNVAQCGAMWRGGVLGLVSYKKTQQKVHPGTPPGRPRKLYYSSQLWGKRC